MRCPMSCDYCERSGEPTAQTGGLGRTFSRARWSAGRTDVRAWYEERRRQGGGRPMIQVAVAPTPPTSAPTPPRIRFGCPRTAEDAAQCISHELTALTGHKFHVEGFDASASEPWVRVCGQDGGQLTPAERQLLQEVYLEPIAGTAAKDLPVVLPSTSWRRRAVRLQVMQTAQQLLPQFFPCRGHAETIYQANEVLLLETDPGKISLVTRHGAQIRILNAAGTGSSDCPDEAEAISRLAAMRQRASTLYCPLCGRHILGAPRRHTCGSCASAQQMV